jgi:copper chaperone CopZ
VIWAAVAPTHHITGDLFRPSSIWCAIPRLIHSNAGLRNSCDRYGPIMEEHHFMHSTNVYRPLAIFTALTVGLSANGQVPTEPVSPSEGAIRVQIIADAMCCQGCAQKVAAQLYAAPGVTSVKTDVPSRSVIVTAVPRHKLTLERLWQAVEQGTGGPSKLVTSQAIYLLTRPDKLKPEQRLAAGRYSLVVQKMHCKGCAQKIAAKLYALPGVKSVTIDVPKRTLHMEAAQNRPLSPWALAAAIEQGEDVPLAISGPHGLLTIEWTADAAVTTAAQSTRSPFQGEVR